MTLLKNLNFAFRFRYKFGPGCGLNESTTVFKKKLNVLINVSNKLIKVCNFVSDIRVRKRL